jgi:hypothetical protein
MRRLMSIGLRPELRQLLALRRMPFHAVMTVAYAAVIPSNGCLTVHATRRLCKIGSWRVHE